MERLKFLELIDFFPIGITISDSEGNLLKSNNEGARLLGLKKEEHAKWKLDDPKWHVIRRDHTIMPPDEYPSVRALKENVRIENVEVGIVKKEEVTWINITATPLPGGDGVIVAYLDITQNVNREKDLERLISDRTKFLNIIAHDLRNPFSSIIGFLDLLLEDLNRYPTAKIEKFLQIIRNTSKQTFELLENLLNWSRAQSGSLDFKPEILDITLLVTETLNFLKHHAQQKNIHFCFNFEKHCQAFVDRNMILTVIRNLITNAIKYSFPNNEIIINVKEVYTDIEFSVRDHGVGINQKKIEFLFSQDHVKSTPGTKNETGSGLGLKITKEFVEKHGGEITVNSKEGKGSEFLVRFPKNT